MNVALSATIDRHALEQALREQGEDFFRHVNEHCPHLFAIAPVYVSATQVAQMRAVVEAVERVVALPGWRQNDQTKEVQALAKGVFFGYDFHLNASGVHLIEINTNAGGAFLNALLLHSQRNNSLPGVVIPFPDRNTTNPHLPFKGESEARGQPDGDGGELARGRTLTQAYPIPTLTLPLHPQGVGRGCIAAEAATTTLKGRELSAFLSVNRITAGENLEQIYLDMFRNEWQLVRGDVPLKSIAIVDEHPETQYLHPEFLLAKNLFERAGITADIVDPNALHMRDDGLYLKKAVGMQKIDLVYNRLTDFLLQQHPALLAAHQHKQVVLTPHPDIYAQYADKRNLIRLTDAQGLRELGATEADIATLQAGVPATIKVHADQEATLWAERKQWFFKPATGYGGRGTYRGANVTKRVFQEILQGDYIAQRMASPGEVLVQVQGNQPAAFKFDVRCYVYDGKVQLHAARLYQGQTTNFRTPGGGFAMVCVENPL